jgi:hypothetical protein
MTSTDYWIGPYGVYVSNTVDAVRADDGVNTLYKDGCVTERACSTMLSKEQYLQQYAELKDDKYWYVEYKFGNSIEPSPEIIEEYQNKKPCIKSELKALPCKKI